MIDIVDYTVRNFAFFLKNSWRSIGRSSEMLQRMSAAELHFDWLQANWEIAVEAVLRDRLIDNLYLEPYGEGAECNDLSDRVWRPDARATHRIVCVASSDSGIFDLLTKAYIQVDCHAVVFDRFVTLTSKGWYEEAPPFDCVIAYYEGSELLFYIDDIRFELSPIHLTMT